MVVILEKLENFVFGRKCNFTLRVLQISVIGVIMILEVIQFTYYNEFFVKRLKWTKSQYFSIELKNVFGLKSYFAFAILFTWIDTAIFIGLFHKFWGKADNNKLNIISDLIFTALWLSVCLTNIIPYYKFTNNLNCPNYKSYSNQEFLYFTGLCRAYFGSVALSWIMFFLFGITSFVSWRAYKKELKEKIIKITNNE